MDTDTEKEIKHLKYVIRTLIVWITQSAGSPLSPANAGQLLKMLDGEDDQN